MDLEDLMAKVLSRYESDLLCEIIEHYGRKNQNGELVDVDVCAIEDFLGILGSDGIRLGCEYWFYDIKNKLDFNDVERSRVKSGLKFFCKLYKGEGKCKNIIIDDNSDNRKSRCRNFFSAVYYAEFRHWLIYCDGKSNATANNYIYGFILAQKHYNLCSQSNLCFYDTKDICVLQPIFDKYINGEYSQIGKKYSGAVRASLQAYLRFLWLTINDNRID